jgi:hypothetical protein
MVTCTHTIHLRTLLRVTRVGDDEARQRLRRDLEYTQPKLAHPIVCGER